MWFWPYLPKSQVEIKYEIEWTSVYTFVCISLTKCISLYIGRLMVEAFTWRTWVFFIADLVTELSFVITKSVIYRHFHGSFTNLKKKSMNHILLLRCFYTNSTCMFPLLLLFPRLPKESTCIETTSRKAQNQPTWSTIGRFAKILVRLMHLLTNTKVLWSATNCWQKDKANICATWHAILYAKCDHFWWCNRVNKLYLLHEDWIKLCLKYLAHC